jgi:hypothetical protein
MSSAPVLFQRLGSRIMAVPVSGGFRLSEATVYGNKVAVYYRDGVVKVDIKGTTIKFKTEETPVLACEQIVDMLNDPLYAWQVLSDYVEAPDLEKKSTEALIKKVGGYTEEEEM